MLHKFEEPLLRNVTFLVDVVDSKREFLGIGGFDPGLEAFRVILHRVNTHRGVLTEVFLQLVKDLECDGPLVPPR